MLIVQRSFFNVYSIQIACVPHTSRYLLWECGELSGRQEERGRGGRGEGGLDQREKVNKYNWKNQQCA